MQELDGLWLALRVAFCVVTAVFVIGGVIRGIQMGGGRRPDLVTGWDYEPLPDVAAAGRTMGRLYLSMAACMLLIVVLLFAGVRLAVWGLLFGIVLWIWVYAIGAITDRSLSRAGVREKT
ncbi:MAG: hypothetical protein U1E85_10980 [Rhodocyclaceae bacterium]